jgi:hypothetical protein
VGGLLLLAWLVRHVGLDSLTAALTQVAWWHRNSSPLQRPTSERMTRPRASRSSTPSTVSGWLNARAKRFPNPVGTVRNGTDRRTAARALADWVASPPTQTSIEKPSRPAFAHRWSRSRLEKPSILVGHRRARTSRSRSAVALARPRPDPGV